MALGEAIRRTPHFDTVFIGVPPNELRQSHCARTALMAKITIVLREHGTLQAHDMLC